MFHTSDYHAIRIHVAMQVAEVDGRDGFTRVTFTENNDQPCIFLELTSVPRVQISVAANDFVTTLRRDLLVHGKRAFRRRAFALFICFPLARFSDCRWRLALTTACVGSRSVSFLALVALSFFCIYAAAHCQHRLLPIVVDKANR